MGKLIVDVGNKEYKYVSRIIRKSDGTRTLSYSLNEADALDESYFLICQGITDFKVMIEH